MEDNYANELVEVNCTNAHQPDKVSYETTVQLMQNFAGTVIGFWIFKRR